MRTIKFMLGCAAVICFGASAQVTYVGDGSVLKIFTDNDNYGGCMAFVDFDPATGGTTCDNFVSFGCDGAYISKSQASANFGLAQLAMVTGVPVNIFVDPSKRYNEAHCLVTRIDVAAP